MAFVPVPAVELPPPQPPFQPEVRSQPLLPGWQLALGAGLLVALIAAGLFLGGEVGAFMAAGLTVLPFMALAVLAYLGAGRPWAKALAIIALVALAGLYALYGLALSLITLNGAFRQGALFNLTAAQWVQMGLIILGLFVAPMLGGLVFIPGIRRRLTRRLPFDPQSFVQTVALATVITLTLIGFLPLLVLAAPPLLGALKGLPNGGADLAGVRGSGGQLRDQLYGLVWTIPAAIVAVGYGIRRNLHDALQRLGLVRPTRRQVLLALGLAVLAVIASQFLDAGIATVWGQFGWPRTDQAAFEKLLAFAISPIGAVVLGVTAGLGEELAIRGVLQPRLGILLSNLFFTSLHAFQYNWDALLSVFLLGLLMGFVRSRTNTTTSAILHGTYDASLVLLSVLQIPGF